MNVLLGFKSDQHSNAFFSSFSVRVRRKVFEGLAINGTNVLSIIVQLILEPGTITSNSLIWIFIKLSIALFWMLGILCIRMRLEKLRKYHKIIFLLFNVLQTLSLTNLFPYFSQAQQKSLGPLGLLIYGWCIGIEYVCGSVLIDSWQMKVMHCLGQVIFFAVYVFEVEAQPRSVFIILLAMFFMFSFSVYLREKYTRVDFLEKRKIYENSEAVKTILDDITEGIVIINQNKDILYLNQPVQRMFKLEDQTTASLFSKFKIKSFMGLRLSNVQVSGLPNLNEEVKLRFNKSLINYYF